jgi:hypothetical protein
MNDPLFHFFQERCDDDAHHEPALLLAGQAVPRLDGEEPVDFLLGSILRIRLGRNLRVKSQNSHFKT